MLGSVSVTTLFIANGNKQSTLGPRTTFPKCVLVVRQIPCSFYSWSKDLFSFFMEFWIVLETKRIFFILDQVMTFLCTGFKVLIIAPTRWNCQQRCLPTEWDSNSEGVFLFSFRSCWISSRSALRYPQFVTIWTIGPIPIYNSVCHLPLPFAINNSTNHSDKYKFASHSCSS